MGVQEQDMLDRIMSPGGPTRRIIALRQQGTLPQPGIWHRDFVSVRNVAAAEGKPLVAVWTNGDLCGFCRRFAENALDPVFVEWMRESDCYFWLGGSMDPENNRSGYGWDFLIKSGVCGTFPLVAVYQELNGVVARRFFGAGHDFDSGKSGPDGARAAVEAIKHALSSPPQNLEARRKEIQEAMERARGERGRQGGAAGCPGHSGDRGGCPGGHPHLKAIQEIAKIIAPFTTQPGGAPQASSGSGGMRIRMNPVLTLQERNRRVQAVIDNGGHCPCVPEKTDATLCLCTDFTSGSGTGLCRCGLFERYLSR